MDSITRGHSHCFLCALTSSEKPLHCQAASICLPQTGKHLRPNLPLGTSLHLEWLWTEVLFTESTLGKDKDLWNSRAESKTSGLSRAMLGMSGISVVRFPPNFSYSTTKNQEKKENLLTQITDKRYSERKARGPAQKGMPEALPALVVPSRAGCNIWRTC